MRKIHFCGHYGTIPRFTPQGSRNKGRRLQKQEGTRRNKRAKERVRTRWIWQRCGLLKIAVAKRPVCEKNKKNFPRKIGKEPEKGPVYLFRGSCLTLTLTSRNVSKKWFHWEKRPHRTARFIKIIYTFRPGCLFFSEKGLKKDCLACSVPPEVENYNLANWDRAQQCIADCYERKWVNSSPMIRRNDISWNFDDAGIGSAKVVICNSSIRYFFIYNYLDSYRTEKSFLKDWIFERRKYHQWGECYSVCY